MKNKRNQFSLLQLMVVVAFSAVVMTFVRFITKNWHKDEVCLMAFSIYFLCIVTPLTLGWMIDRQRRNL